MLPGAAEAWSAGQFRLSTRGSSIELAVADPDACHVMHYGWDGTTVLAVSVPVSPRYGPRDCRISPDGHWLTAVTATAATGGGHGHGHPVPLDHLNPQHDDRRGGLPRQGR